MVVSLARAATPTFTLDLTHCLLAGSCAPGGCRAKQVWKNTGVDVTAGQVLRFSASGSWTYQTGQGPYTPNGVGLVDSDKFLTTANKAALIGIVASNTTLVEKNFGSHCSSSCVSQNSSHYVSIGTSRTWTSPYTGRLYLGFNDDYATVGQAPPDCYDGTIDNGGSATVSVSVCGNGVKEAGEACDGGACCSSTCTLKSAGTVCRASTDPLCDPAEKCTGANSSCPADVRTCTILPGRRILGDTSTVRRGKHANSTTVHRADPVNTATGSFYHQDTDISFPGVGVPFAFTRSYNSLDTTAGTLGIGWSGSYQDSLTINGDGSVLFRSDEGQQLLFTPAGGGTFTAEPGVFSTLSLVGGIYTLLLQDQDRFTFDATGRMLTHQDEYGNQLTFTRDGSGNLTAITDTAGRVISVAVDGSGHISSLTLPDLRSVQYAYSAGKLVSVTDLSGAVTQYQYDASNRLTKIVDPKGHAEVTNVYGSSGRVTDQYDALGTHTSFAWDASTETSTMVDARGGTWVDVYQGNVLQQASDPLGNTTTYTYDTAFNLVEKTDARGNTTTMTYDAHGNLLTQTAPAPLSYVDTYTYDASNHVLTATDGRGGVTAHTYDAAGKLLTTTDALGHVTSYTYDSSGQLQTMTDANLHTTHYTYESGNLIRQASPLGYAKTATYDGTGRKTSEVEERGYPTQYTYDGMNRVLTVVDPLGHTTTNTYDASGNLLSTTEPTGAVTSYTYDAADQRVTEVAADGGITTYQYDASGHTIAVIDPLGNKTTRTYDAAGREATKVTARGYAPDGLPATFTWTYTYDENGNVLTATDPLGNATTNTYDVLNRMASTTDPAGRTTTYSYDAVGNRTGVADALGETTTSDYDLLSRVIAVTDPTGNTTTFTYDDVGNRTAITSPLGETTTSTYDADDRLTETVDPRGNAPGGTPSLYKTVTTYDAADHPLSVTDPLGHTRTMTYDPVGKETSATDANGHTTTYVYDAANRITQVVDPLGNPTTLVRDVMGRVIARTDANGHTTTYTYDLAQQLLETTSPLGKQWTNIYDPEGHRTAMVDPRGHAASDPATGTIAYDYDAAGRLTAVDYGDATPDVSYLLDPSGMALAMTDDQGTSGAAAYTLDGVGRRTAVTRDGNAIEYEYDEAGRVVGRTYPTGPLGKPFEEAAAYDADGRVTSVSMNDAPVVTYAYDLAGNLVGRSFANGVVETRTYDSADHVLEVSHSLGSIVLARFDYTYDAVGNPTVVDTLTGAESYSYDAADRVTEVCYTPACMEPGSFIQYAYDGVGNRLTETRSTGTTTYAYDADDELMAVTTPSNAVTSYAYDPAGNQVGAAGNQFDYDLANRVTRALSAGHSWSYAYDGNGRRLSASRTGAPLPTTRFLWDTNGSLPLLALELKGNGKEYRRYITADGPIATGKKTKLTGYYHLDRLGSVRAMTNRSGRLVGSESYEPFGADRGLVHGALKKNAFRFAGEYFDATTAMYHLRARQYAPTTGRFLSRDPVEPSIDEAFTSSYVYAEDRPTLLTDPSGERPEKKCRIHGRPCTRDEEAFFKLSPAKQAKAVAFFKALKHAADVKLWNDTILWNNTVKWNNTIKWNAALAHNAAVARRKSARKRSGVHHAVLTNVVCDYGQQSDVGTAANFAKNPSVGGILGAILALQNLGRDIVLAVGGDPGPIANDAIGAGAYGSCFVDEGAPAGVDPCDYPQWQYQCQENGMIANGIDKSLGIANY